MLRQSISLFSLILFCTSTPHVLAQKSAKSPATAVQYTYDILAKIPAKQSIVLGGMKVIGIGNPILTDSGDVVFGATMSNKDGDSAVFKNQHCLLYNGQKISAFNNDGKTREPAIVTTNIAPLRIQRVTEAGDVYCSCYTTDAGQPLQYFLNGDVIPPNFYSAAYNQPLFPYYDYKPNHIDPVGVLADELYKKIFGLKNVKNGFDTFGFLYPSHVDITYGNAVNIFTITNRRGQLATRLAGKYGEAIIILTPTKAHAPEPEVASMRTDANRDGTITFDDADKSTPAHPYTFWLNNNSDVFMAEENEDEDQDPALAKLVDSSLPKIPNARDLEDFERLQIKLPSDFNADSGQWKVTLELAPLSPASGTPRINVVPAPTTGMDYLTGKNDQEIANLPNSSKVEITESKRAAVQGVKGTSLDLKTFHIQEGTGILPLLFEGKTAGKGVLTVHVYKSGTEVAKDKTYLNLLPITEMYDHYTADPLQQKEPGNPQNDSGDSNSVTQDQILTGSPQSPLGVVNLDKTTHENSDGTPDNDYILFVHGWRMPRWERIAFAQTAFKRLWHLGYKGRFGFFSWPTEYTTTDIPTMAINHANYDDSEWKAYISAQALRSLLATLNQKYTVRVFAHSMGNVVTGEALRLESESNSPRKLVQTYVATQAAVAAQAYDVIAPTVTLHDPAPNVYAFYPTGSSSNGTPYFGSIGKAAGNLVNFFNPDDYALKNWRIDQSLKPDKGYTYVLNGQAQPYPQDHLLDGFYHGETPLLMPQNAYEIFAKAAPAYSLALGAQTGVGGPFSKQVDLHQTCDFSDKPNNHSAQFEDTFSKRQYYWELLLKEFNVGESIPN